MHDPTRMPKLLSALKLGKAGLRVLPVRPDSKSPAFKGWPEDATTDRAQIERWWGEEPEFNIGICTTGMLVVDIDVAKGGLASWLELTEFLEVPPTFTVKTWSGGYHLYFSLKEGQEVRNSESELADWIDIRGHHGQALGPGSVFNGKPYQVLTEPENGIVPLAPRKKGELPVVMYAPDWLVRLCAKPAAKKSELAGIRLNEETERTVDAAIDYLQNRAPIAIQGEGGDKTTYQVAAELGDIGVDLDTAYHLMLEEWNERCEGPWEPDDLRVKAESGYRNRQNAIGIKNPDLGDKVFEGFEWPGDEEINASEKLAPIPVPSEDSFAPKPVLLLSRRIIPRREWIIEGMTVRQKVTALIGPGGVGKSIWELQLAVAAALARGDMCGFRVPNRARVWVWNQEDEEEELDRRLMGVTQHFKVTDEDLLDENGAPMLYRNSGVEEPLILGLENDRVAQPNRKVIKKMIDYVRDNAIDLLTIDPIAELHRLNELDNGDMKLVWGALRDIAIQGNCAVLAAAHSRKPPNGDSEGHIGSLDTLRGASAQGGIIRKAETLFTPSAKDLKRFKFPVGSKREDFVRMDDAKNNLGRMRTEPLWFKRHGVRIENGEMVGVLVPITIASSVEESVDLLGPLIEAVKSLGPGRHQWLTVRSAIVAQHRPAFDAMKDNAAREIGDIMLGRDQIPLDDGVFKRMKISNRWEYWFEPRNHEAIPSKPDGGAGNASAAGTSAGSHQ
jgi:hypothetical protein